jgi:hypothetical protein
MKKILPAAFAALVGAGLLCCGGEPTGPGGSDFWSYALTLNTRLENGGITDMWFNGADDGWACLGARIFHYDGERWSTFHDFHAEYEGLTIKQISALGEDCVWAAAEGYPNVTLLHYDGQSWETIYVPRLYVEDLYFSSPNAGWAAGPGGIFYYDGRGWTKRADYSVDGFSFVAPDRGWGYDPWGIYEWNGVSWRPAPFKPERHLRGISFSAPDDGWAFTVDDRLYHYDGEAWTEASFPGEDIRALHFASPASGWIVTQGTTWQVRGVGRYVKRDYDPLDPPAISVYVVGDDVWAGTNTRLEKVGGEKRGFAYIYHAKVPR